MIDKLKSGYVESYSIPILRGVNETSEVDPVLLHKFLPGILEVREDLELCLVHKDDNEVILSANFIEELKGEILALLNINNQAEKTKEYELKTKILAELPPVDLKGTYVFSPCYEVRNLDEALACGGVQNCSVLTIIDKSKKKHYMGHIDGDVSVQEILNSLEGVDLNSSEIYVLPGFSGALSFERIFVALLKKEVAKKTVILSCDYKNKITGGLGMTSHDGELYLDPEEAEDFGTTYESNKKYEV